MKMKNKIINLFTKEKIKQKLIKIKFNMVKKVIAIIDVKAIAKMSFFSWTKLITFSMCPPF